MGNIKWMRLLLCMQHGYFIALFIVQGVCWLFECDGQTTDVVRQQRKKSLAYRERGGEEDTRMGWGVVDLDRYFVCMQNVNGIIVHSASVG